MWKNPGTAKRIRLRFRNPQLGVELFALFFLCLRVRFESELGGIVFVYLLFLVLSVVDFARGVPSVLEPLN